MTLIAVIVHPASGENYRIEQDATEKMFYDGVASVLRDFQNKNKHYFEVAVFEAFSGKDEQEKLAKIMKDAGSVKDES